MHKYMLERNNAKNRHFCAKESNFNKVLEFIANFYQKGFGHPNLPNLWLKYG